MEYARVCGVIKINRFNLDFIARGFFFLFFKHGHSKSQSLKNGMVDDNGPLNIHLDPNFNMLAAAGHRY